jgi:hypothetical protein
VGKVTPKEASDRYRFSVKGKAALAKRQRERRARIAKTRPPRQTRDPKTRRRDSHLKGRYGITLAQFEVLWSLQDRACAICRRKPKRTVVDHHHGTGKVRGILCYSCNNAIGMVRDDANQARALAAYLESAHGHVELVKELV